MIALPKGRVLDIIEGRADKSLEYVNAVRARWDLPPLEESDRPVDRIGMTVTVIEAPEEEPKPKRIPSPRRGTGTAPRRKGRRRETSRFRHNYGNYPPIERVDLSNPMRHLMFHVWPVAGYGAWQWNCDRLLATAGLFNGRRIVSIVTSGETDSADAVRHYLRDFTTEFIVKPNDKKLREVLTWLPMLERLQEYQSPQDVLFTCHGKCVRHKIGSDNAGSTVFRWTDAMYETCLDWDAVRPLLETHGTVGSFRRFGVCRKGGFGPWHFSGTFYWMRLRDAFRRDWRYVPKKFFGTEAYPGWMFKPEEAGCIACDQIADLYNLDHWMKDIEPQLAAWRAKRGASK